ncbi:MAG: hypothetical protein U0350_27930 [Caldilineaceae bacterium]
MSTGDLEEAYVKRAFSERAAETLVLAVGEKLGVASADVIAPVTQVSGMIVKPDASEATLTHFLELGLSV